MGTTCLNPSEIAALPYQLYVCDLIADLEAIDVTPDASAFSAARQALVAGGSAIGDGSGGTFVYDADSVAVPNGSTIVAPLVGPGNWLIVSEGGGGASGALASGVFVFNSTTVDTFNIPYGSTLAVAPTSAEVKFFLTGNGAATIPIGVPVMNGSQTSLKVVISASLESATLYACRWAVFP